MVALSDGDVELSNDDRGEFLNLADSGRLEPALGAFLEPGDYEVTVSVWRDTAGADFAIVAETVPTFALGDTVEVEIGEGESWVGAFEVPDGGLVTIDTVSPDDVDPRLGLFTADGEADGIDDSSEGAGTWNDPYLEIELAPGFHFISMSDYTHGPLTAELTVTME